MRTPKQGDGFEHQFDDAVEAMHSRRSDSPSEDVWPKVLNRASQHTLRKPHRPHKHVRSAAPIPERGRHQGPAPTGKNGTSQRRRGLSTWLSGALVFMLVVGGLAAINSYRFRDETPLDIAWAPAPSSPDLSTPATSTPYPPLAGISTPGPEYACHAEPLTTDQVMDIVMNPQREYERRSGGGASQFAAELDEREYMGHLTFTYNGALNLQTTDDPAIVDPVIQTSNMFWNCLLSGTALQVWALMDPYTVQQDILVNFPVLRDEESLREFVTEAGPRPYGYNRATSFPAPIGIDPVTVSYVADTGYGSIKAEYLPGDLGGMHATVLMIPNPDSGRSPLEFITLYMRQAPDGSWWVVSVDFDHGRSRG